MVSRLHRSGDGSGSLRVICFCGSCFTLRWQLRGHRSIAMVVLSVLPIPHEMCKLLVGCDLPHTDKT